LLLLLLLLARRLGSGAPHDHAWVESSVERSASRRRVAMVVGVQASWLRGFHYLGRC